MHKQTQTIACMDPTCQPEPDGRCRWQSTPLENNTDRQTSIPVRRIFLRATTFYFLKKDQQVEKDCHA